MLQDKVDDVLLGIKSTAIKFGDDTKLWLSGFGASMIGGLILSGLNCSIGWPYYLSVTAVACHLASQVCFLKFVVEMEMLDFALLHLDKIYIFGTGLQVRH